jgi:hypothetical protein
MGEGWGGECSRCPKFGEGEFLREETKRHERDFQTSIANCALVLHILEAKAGNLFPPSKKWVKMESPVTVKNKESSSYRSTSASCALTSAAKDNASTPTKDTSASARRDIEKDINKCVKASATRSSVPPLCLFDELFRRYRRV